MKKVKHPEKHAAGKPGGSKEQKPGISGQKFSQVLGIENFNKEGEPLVTPPEDIRKKPAGH